MYFDSISHLLHMDGHGIFVWSTYAIVSLVLVGLVVLPVARHRRLLRDLAHSRSQNPAEEE